MAIRKPLVLDANKEIEQLQTGDSLGGVDYDDFSGINGESSTAMVFGNAVYGITAAMSVKLSKNDSILVNRTLGLIADEGVSIGAGGNVAVVTGGILTATTAANWTPSIKEGGLLLPWNNYWLSDVFGKITATPPTSGWLVKVGVALSTFDFLIKISPPIKL